ncbi:MAG: PIN domain-containing protein [Planctomycetes bacterium]|nr:PIN domain-containing protein [Planctomycetota bacterium]
MKVLVDTSIWSLALRRGTSKEYLLSNELSELIQEVRVQIIGPIRQEILSGIKSQKQFGKLKSYLSEFPDIPLETAYFEKAAEFFNANRKKGIQGSNTDFLICSVAYHRDLEIFTADKDFVRFQKHIPIKLYSPRTTL